MSIDGILHWVDETAFADTVRESLWLFPLLETIHVLSLVLVVGSIARLDLRLAGLIERDKPIRVIQQQMLPWTWAAFAVAVVFGLLLFAGKPFVYLDMAFFDVKIFLIVLAGINMLVFELMTIRGIDAWDRAVLPPVNVRLAAGLSLAFWTSVVVCGRLIGFV